MLLVSFLLKYFIEHNMVFMFEVSVLQEKASSAKSIHPKSQI